MDRCVRERFLELAKGDARPETELTFISTILFASAAKDEKGGALPLPCMDLLVTETTGPLLTDGSGCGEPSPVGNEDVAIGRPEVGGDHDVTREITVMARCRQQLAEQNRIDAARFK